MSQNYVYDKETETLLMAGWDKPVQEAYLIIGTLNEEGDEWNHPLPVDRVTPFDRVNSIQYVDEIIVQYSGIAQMHGIELPQSLKVVLADQIRRNAVNEFAIHEEGKEPVILFDGPFHTNYFRSGQVD